MTTGGPEVILYSLCCFSIFVDGYVMLCYLLIYLFMCFYFLTHYFSALGQVKQTTFMSPLGFTLPSAPGHTTVKQARKKSNYTELFHLTLVS